MTNPSAEYVRGRIAAMRDYEAYRRVRHGLSYETQDFQHGYSDGWHKASGGELL